MIDGARMEPSNPDGADLGFRICPRMNDQSMTLTKPSTEMSGDNRR
jgi:hypothetical protein